MVAEPGDNVYLGSVLSRLHFYGIVSDMDQPGGVTGTFELADGDGAITLDALVGPPGPPGQPADIVKMQLASSIDDPEDLPQNLTDDPVDVGKAWWIGNVVYIWDGHQYRIKQMGTQGPPGPVPQITPTVELLNPDDPNVSNEVIVSGTSTHPTWLLRLKAPRGPKGDNATIRDATDYDDSVPPSVGQVIAWNGKDFAPQDPNVLTPRFFTVPQANFVNFTGISTRHTIGSFLIPPMPFDYVPIVWGHIKSTGVELDADPFIIGCEVRIGNATSGELIGRGFGNISTWTTIVPHVSTNQDITRAISPDNGVGVIPGYSTGEASTLYINLFNDGLAGVYQFNRNNAQLAVMVMPVSPLLEPES